MTDPAACEGVGGGKNLSTTPTVSPTLSGMGFDWVKAIEFNRVALLGVVATLLSVLARGQEDGAVFLALCRRRFLLRLLVPAEAAARRLIYLAARVHKVSATARGTGDRPLPDFAAFSAHAARTGRTAPFKLVDPRKRLDWSAFLPEPVIETAPDDVPAPCADLYELVSCTDLYGRTAALEAALKELKKSARRMVREETKRQRAEPGPASVPPLRMGKPPGHRQKRSHEVDDILKELAGLVRDLDRPPKFYVPLHHAML